MAKKTTKKRKTTSTKTIFSNKKIVLTALSIIIILIGGSSFIGGYYFAKFSISTPKQLSQNNNTKQTKKALEELQHLVDENINPPKNKKEIVSKKPKSVITKKVINSEGQDYAENTHKEEEIKHIKPIIYTTKPKLVIIMDDMSFHSQVRELKNLGIKVTPSFFPPTKRHPKTAIYAKEFSHYMVHFPMQATNPNFKEEADTLHIDSSYKFIANRVRFIKKEFPKVEFVNNHTGSKFTSNYKAMNKLYLVLNRYHLVFVDSRTTSKTKAPEIAKKYHDILLSRDVFLDNKENISYIQNQLRKAVKIAEKRGYAIAICHPHSKTFQALKQSKFILKNVEVIYIDELYKLYKTNHLSRL